MGHLKTPQRSVSKPYQDDRFAKTPWSINIRHIESVEIFRFRTKEEAREARKLFKDQGYQMVKRG